MTISLAYRELYVSDIDASIRFYEGLGFIDERSGQDGRTYGTHSSEQILLSNVHGVMLNLVCVGSLAGTGQRRPMTALGLTHLNFYVRDFEATLDTVRQRGGTVAEETLIATAHAASRTSMIYCTDPDGIRVEIWSTTPYGPGGFSSAIAGVDRKFSHSGICVRDLDQSAAFYQALGFEPAETFDYRDPPGQLDRMFEETDSSALAQMMRNGNDVVELLHFLNPRPRYLAEWNDPKRRGFHKLVFLANSPGNLSELGFGHEDGQTSRRMTGVDPNGVRIDLILSETI